MQEAKSNYFTSLLRGLARRISPRNLSNRLRATGSGFSRFLLGLCVLGLGISFTPNCCFMRDMGNVGYSLILPPRISTVQRITYRHDYVSAFDAFDKFTERNQNKITAEIPYRVNPGIFKDYPEHWGVR